jgi:hypothetical protein
MRQRRNLKWDSETAHEPLDPWTYHVSHRRPTFERRRQKLDFETVSGFWSVNSLAVIFAIFEQYGGNIE